MLKSSRKPNLMAQIKPLKQEDKFFSRVLSKESSISNPSFRIYYGDVPRAVPFIWEIQPGTPKHKFFPKDDTVYNNTPPTLTPPPSFYFTPPHHQIKPTKKHSSIFKLKNILFLRKKNQLRTSSSSSSSSFSSSSFSSSSLSNSSVVASTQSSNKVGYRRRRLLSIGSSFDDRDSVYDQASYTRNRSLSSCFGIQF